MGSSLHYSRLKTFFEHVDFFCLRFIFILEPNRLHFKRCEAEIVLARETSVESLKGPAWLETL
jgi:hypothetical protein